MLINKLLKLENIGVFDCYKVDSSSWNKEFKKNNLIYAENGQGKTTLSVIFESLAKGNNDLLIGRRTLGGTSEQKIEIMNGSSRINFANDQWSQTMPHMEVFNAKFITENLYVGDTVNLEQKRNLHTFVIGAEGVELIQEIDFLDVENRKIQKEISSSKKTLLTHIKTDMSVEEFIELEFFEDIDSQIKHTETVIKNLEQSKEINLHPKLEEISFTLPRFEGIQEILLRSYENLSKESEELVFQQIKELRDESAEDWLNKGFKLINNDTCPFCSADISNNSIIEAYQNYFSKKYNDYRIELESGIKDIIDKFNQTNMIKLESVIKNNIKETEYWTQKMDNDNIHGINTDLLSVLESLSEMLRELFNIKKKDILASIMIPDELVDNYKVVEKEISSLNSIITDINSEIIKFKQSIEKIDLLESRQNLETLRLSRIRWQEDIVIVCKEYNALVEKKKNDEVKKDSTRRKLDIYLEDFRSNFSQEINELLRKFGAAFSICEVKTDYRGGPKFEYNLCINESSIPLVDSKNRETVAQFKNTLSEGDKTTLAFVFFIAKIIKSPDINSKILVVDDPISSLDFHRLNMTAGILSKLVIDVKQIFVLTHDLKFAKKYFDRTHHGNNLLMLEIKGKEFRRFDIDKQHLSEYFRNYFIIDDYINDESYESEISVARAIRPLMEGHLRMHYPKHFTCKKWLGDFIIMIRDAEESDPYINIKDMLSEIEDINEYSKHFHHEGADSSLINSTELKSFCEQAINFCS